MKQKRKTGRKLLAILLTLAMFVGLMPGMSLTAYAAGGGIEVTKANVICQQYSYFDAGSYSGGGYDTPPVDITNITLAKAQAFGTAVNCPTTYWVVVYAKDGDNLKWTSNGKTGEHTSTPFKTSSAWSMLYNGDVFSLGDPPSNVTFYFSKGLASVAVTGVELNKTETTLSVGDTETLAATVKPENATDKSVTWSSSNTAVATVSDGGLVTAVAAGTANITATATNGTNDADDDKFLTCLVTVNKKAGTISYAQANVSKSNGDAAFTNALTNTGDGAVSYASDNTDAAIVDATTGEVTIVSYGEANITATVTDSNTYAYATKTASYQLIVAKRSYEVTFDENGHGTAPASQTVAEDSKVTKPDDLFSTDYDFTGWYKEAACTNKWNFDTDIVTGTTTIYAGWKIKSFTVTWTNYDDSVLKTDTVNYGETPAYTGATPTKPADAQYTYTFVGWTPEINTVTGDVTYKATYTNAKNKYTVKWLNYDNTVLQEGTVDYGVTPEYTGATPTKPADEQYTYTFLSWTPVVIPVVDNVVYVATYTNTVNKYTIKFVDEDGTEISSAEYDYGTSANDIVKPDDPTKDATAEYTYKFAGWDSEVTDVTGNKTYKATYTQTEIKKDDGEKAVSTEVKKDEKSPEVKAANLTNEFAESTLSNEEKTAIDEAINNGEDVNVDVYLEIKDISDAISPSDKEKIKASTTNADNIEYFDISVFKEISISGQSQGATSIHELTTPLKLTIGVPKSFPAVADGYKRTYVVLRLHDGSVTVLPTTLNADGTLSFETDKFSTYALAYTDTKKEEVTTETPTTETPTTEAPTTKVDTPTTEAPKADTPKAPTTGDKINLGVIVMLMIDSAMAGLYLTLRRRSMK